MASNLLCHAYHLNERLSKYLSPLKFYPLTWDHKQKRWESETNLQKLLSYYLINEGYSIIGHGGLCLLLLITSVLYPGKILMKQTVVAILPYAVLIFCVSTLDSLLISSGEELWPC